MIVVILFILAVLGLILLFIKGPKYQGKMSYKLNVPLVLVGVLAFAGTTKLVLEKEYCPTILAILHLLMKIMDILTAWQLRYLIQESECRGITVKRR